MDYAFQHKYHSEKTKPVFNVVRAAPDIAVPLRFASATVAARQLFSLANCWRGCASRSLGNRPKMNS